MTEHYTESANSANDWPLALDVGEELNDSMSSNFSAYVWWWIRRGYGLITEDSEVSKRGYLMAQYSKFIRPGFTRIGATQPEGANVKVTAYKNDSGKLVVVAVNLGGAPQNVTLDVFNGCADTLTQFTTSQTKNVVNDGTVTVTDNRAEVTLDGQSVTTFVSP